MKHTSFAEDVTDVEDEKPKSNRSERSDKRNKDRGPEAPLKSSIEIEGESQMRRSRAIANRKYRFSSRDNSAFKWMEDKSVVGALEVECEPQLNLRAKFQKKGVAVFGDEFEECLEIWEELKLRSSFISAAESIPPKTKCCGLAVDTNKTVQDLVRLLNQGWAKKTSEKIKDRGYKIGCFCWSWSNPTGSADTNILLIRFHSLTKQRP